LKKKSIIYLLPVLILVFSAVIPGVMAKKGIPSHEKVTIYLSGEITGIVVSNKWEEGWGLHFRAHYQAGVDEPPILSFNSEEFGEFKAPPPTTGHDFQLDVNEKKGEASLYFAWNKGGKRYRLLVSGDYTETSGEYTVYTLENAQAEIYLMKRPKGELVLDPPPPIEVTFSFYYKPNP